MNSVPVSMRAPSSSAAASSVVQTPAVSPYGLSFMSCTAWSSESTGMIPTTGPNVSSIITRMP